MQRTLGWVGLGVGGAGLVFGGVTGLVVLSKKSALEDDGCVDARCYSDQADDVDSYNSMRTLSTVGFAVGGLGVAAGAALLGFLRFLLAQRSTMLTIAAGLLTLLFYASMALTGLLLIVAFFNERGRCLHDYLSGTITVVNVGEEVA